MPGLALQRFDFVPEDIRLLTYIRSQNVMALVLAAAYFTMVYLNLTSFAY